MAGSVLLSAERYVTIFTEYQITYFCHIGSTDSFSGHVEVFYSGTWGTVCSNSFDLRAADMVYRKLGHMHD